MMASRDDASRQPPLVVHLIYRLDFGGLETLLVERINRMPADALPPRGRLPDRLHRLSPTRSRGPASSCIALDKRPGLGLAPTSSC